MSELRTIPNIGACTEQDLILMGYTTIASLRGKSAEELYAEECRLRGCTLDRCQLYLYRAVEYFVNTGNPDPMKCKWWFWKDDFVDWLRYTGDDVCRIYDCCRTKRKKNCGDCPDLPCGYFVKDPTVSDEQNEANLCKMVERLRADVGNNINYANRTDE